MTFEELLEALKEMESLGVDMKNPAPLEDRKDDSLKEDVVSYTSSHVAQGGETLSFSVDVKPQFGRYQGSSARIITSNPRSAYFFQRA